MHEYEFTLKFSLQNAQADPQEYVESLGKAGCDDALIGIGQCGRIAFSCPYNDSECRCGEFCIASIWSTPRNLGNHARQIRRVVDHCTTRMRSENGER